MGGQITSDLNFEDSGAFAMDDAHSEIACLERRMQEFIYFWQRLDHGKGVEIETWYAFRKSRSAL